MENGQVKFMLLIETTEAVQNLDTILHNSCDRVTSAVLGKNTEQDQLC